MNIIKSLFMITVAFIFSCSGSNNGQDTVDQNTLVGEWQLTAKYDGGNIENPIGAINNGKKITFMKSGSFEDSFLPDCEATYLTEGEIVNLNYSCLTEVKSYKYSFEDGKLIFRLQGGSCDEACYDIYERL